MLNKKRSFKSILIKIIDIYLFLIALSIIIGIIYIFLSGKNLEYILEIFTNIFIQKGPLNLLWFMIALSIVYTLTPILYKVKNNKYLIYFLIILSSIIFMSNIFFSRYYKILLTNIIVQPLRLWTWITYYMLGAYFRGNNIKYKSNWILIIIVSILNINYGYFIGKYLLNDMRAELFYDSFFVKIWVVITYDFVMKISLNEKYNNEILKLSKATLGVYIFQIPLISIIDYICKGNSNLFFNIIMFLISLLGLFSVSLLINKTKYLSKLLNMKMIGEKKK